MRRKSQFTIAAFSLGLAAAAACGKGHQPSAPQPPLRVRVAPALVAGSGGRETAGAVEPRNLAVIAARLSGTVGSVTIAAGDAVTRGRLLIVIEAPAAAAAAQAAAAARDQAAADLHRAEMLAAEKAATPAQLAQARTAAARANAEQARAQDQLASTRIVSPSDGLVLERLVDPGSVVMPGQPLLRIAGAGGVRVSSELDERLAAGLRPGHAVRLAMADGTEFSGTVERVFPAADAAARTVTVWIVPARTDLMPGASVAVRWPSAEMEYESGAVEVPASALVRRGGASFVYTVAEGIARLRLVRPGEARGSRIVIISGLTAGESVVTDPGAGLSDGCAVLAVTSS